MGKYSDDGNWEHQQQVYLPFTSSKRDSLYFKVAAAFNFDEKNREFYANHNKLLKSSLVHKQIS